MFYRALHYYWGYQWVEAAIVSYGESTWHTWARNGQYHGTFQMGARERAKYGNYGDYWGQVKAAHRYYLDAGWRPWDCA